MEFIDFRSDTVTLPTPAMREAMRSAPVGDDVYGDDPTVNKLEAVAAAMLGKEAALFVPTGTMGNQIAIMAHTRSGEEIIAGMQSHIVVNEAGGAARLSGVSTAMANNPDTKIYPSDIERLVRDADDVHYPRSRLLCLENALANGDVVSVAEMRALHDAARAHGLQIHLDGARLFNAAAALGVDAREIADCVDSISCCLSKGLCAPVGSVVCGSNNFINEARRCRKVLGGGMRQAGVLAACGLISLEEMTKRLHEDHANARLLARLLAELPELEVDTATSKINMVYWRPLGTFDGAAFVAFMEGKGFKVSLPHGGPFYRLVTHHGIGTAEVENYVKLFKEFLTK